MSSGATIFLPNTGVKGRLQCGEASEVFFYSIRSAAVLWAPCDSTETHDECYSSLLFYSVVDCLPKRIESCEKYKWATFNIITNGVFYCNATSYDIPKKRRFTDSASTKELHQTRADRTQNSTIPALAASTSRGHLRNQGILRYPWRNSFLRLLRRRLELDTAFYTRDARASDTQRADANTVCR